MRVEEEKKIHEIGWKRAADFQVCTTLKFKANQLMKDEPYVCLGLRHIHSESSAGTKPVLSWEFDMLKTKKGCASFYADEDCAYSHWRKQGFPVKPFKDIP
jgi:hypothetical protein